MRAILLVPALALVCAGGLAVAGPSANPIAIAKREAQAAAERAEALQKQATQATGEAERARIEAAALAARIEQAESDITAAQLRIAEVEQLRAAQRARLAKRQEPVIRLTAALQTMARRPPALALVQPGSIDEIVRVRALLASTLPTVRARTADVRQAMAESEALRAEAVDAAAALAAGQDALRRQRQALAEIELAQRQRSAGFAEAALLESDRSLALGEEARALARRLSTAEAEARTRAELMALPGPSPRPAADSGEPNTKTPPYRLPVEGRLLTGMGEISDAGVHARGTAFATAPNAPVVAPRAGRIRFAGRFRSYGEVVIIDHGGGWTTTITGLAALRVRKGNSVRAGEPIGRAGRDTPVVGVELRRNGEPYPIAPLILPG